MKYSLCNELLNSKKILHCLIDHFPEYMNGKTSFNPWAVEIHPTARCNHQCIHCSYKERNEKRDTLKKEVMDDLIDSIIKMNVKGVYFSGGGEPTMYPELKKYIEKLYKAGVDVAILTNGTLLEKSGIIDIANMLNYIAISVPSCDPANFEKITGSKLIDNVLNAPEKIKKTHQEKSPIIGARIVITNLIYKEVASILQTMKDKKFDYALFKVVRDYEDRGLGLGREEEEYLKNTISKMEIAEKIDDDYTNLKYIFHFKKEIKYSEKCLTNEMGMIANINTDGKVYPNIVYIGNEDFGIGDIYRTRLEKIWNSDEHHKVKENSNRKWKAKECKNCRAILYNEIMDEFLEEVPKEVDPFI